MEPSEWTRLGSSTYGTCGTSSVGYGCIVRRVGVPGSAVTLLLRQVGNGIPHSVRCVLRHIAQANAICSQCTRLNTGDLVQVSLGGEPERELDGHRDELEESCCGVVEETADVEVCQQRLKSERCERITRRAGVEGKEGAEEEEGQNGGLQCS